MSIGIMDADMARYLIIPFNIQVMKISAYYKSKREIVVLSNEFTPYRNQKFFYCKDWDNGDFPENINDHRVQYCGHAFSGPQYVPLDMNIEQMKPDTTIYSIMENKFSETNFTQRVFKNMSSAEHCQLSLDNKSVWENYSRQFVDLRNAKHIMFHDYDLGNIEGSYEIVKSIVSECKRIPRVGTKFPINIYNGEDLIKWSSFKMNRIFYSLRYNGIIPLQDFYNWCSIPNLEKQNYNLLEYNITGKDFNETQFLVSELNNLLRQIVISRSYKRKILLKYDARLFTNPLNAKIIDLFNHYQSSFQNMPEDVFIREVQNDTVYDFAKKSLTTYGKYPKMLIKSEMKELFHYIGDINPSLFKDLYELNFLKLKEEIL